MEAIQCSITEAVSTNNVNHAEIIIAFGSANLVKVVHKDIFAALIHRYAADILQKWYPTRVLVKSHNETTGDVTYCSIRLLKMLYTT